MPGLSRREHVLGGGTLASSWQLMHLPLCVPESCNPSRIQRTGCHERNSHSSQPLAGPVGVYVSKNACRLVYSAFSPLNRWCLDLYSRRRKISAYLALTISRFKHVQVGHSMHAYSDSHETDQTCSRFHPAAVPWFSALSSLCA
jgi:hypothetical protein